MCWFFWRLDRGQWHVYVIDCMHFDDCPAAMGLDIAKNKTADIRKHINKGTAK